MCCLFWFIQTCILKLKCSGKIVINTKMTDYYFVGEIKTTYKFNRMRAPPPFCQKLRVTEYCSIHTKSPLYIYHVIKCVVSGLTHGCVDFNRVMILIWRLFYGILFAFSAAGVRIFILYARIYTQGYNTQSGFIKL